MSDPNGPLSDGEEFRAEIDAAGMDAEAGHLRDGAAAISDTNVEGFGPDIVARMNKNKASTRATIRDTSRSIQALADEHRRQHGI